MNSFIQEIPLKESNYTLNILRLDKIRPDIQGNKFYKLHFNIEYAIQHNLSIVTFGGAYSNHIHATALACNKLNIPAIGIIRGNKFKFKSYTLKYAEELGMQLIYVDRASFKTLRDANKETLNNFLKNKHVLNENFHLIPEGGSNNLGVKGAEDIIDDINSDYDIICCPVGTGGTVSGIINALKGQKSILGFSSLKDEYLINVIKTFTNNQYNNWQLNFDYHFGGYAKWNADLINFINTFKQENNIPLCPIYTGKMMFGILDLIQKNYFKEGSKILAIHTGGLQGIEGFNNANKNILI